MLYVKNQVSAFEQEEKALKHGPKFTTEYMVYFDPKKSEGPYNDVYMYCFIKNQVITKDTIIYDKVTKRKQKAGDCEDLYDFFKLVSLPMQSNEQEQNLHDVWDDKLSHELIDKFIQKANLFDCEDESEIIDEEILENIYEQTKDFNMKEGKVGFQVSALEGYSKEDLTDNQQNELKELANDVFSFLLHKKWDGTLPPKMIDLIVKVADLFDDPYDPAYIDRKICTFTYKIYNSEYEDNYDVDDFLDRLEGLLVDDVNVTPPQNKILQEIAQIQYDYINSQS